MSFTPIYGKEMCNAPLTHPAFHVVFVAVLPDSSHTIGVEFGMRMIEVHIQFTSTTPTLFVDPVRRPEQPGEIHPFTELNGTGDGQDD